MNVLIRSRRAVLVVAIIAVTAAPALAAPAQTWAEITPPTGGPSGAIPGHIFFGSACDAANNRLIVSFPSNPAVSSGRSSEVWC